MSPVQASCPACGAPIQFNIGSSVVRICDYCNSVVARGDRKLEDLGKVADLVETGSPLQLGLRGVYRGVPFELTGRAQLGHAAGGLWDEWYAAFQDGRWGWLAEAQGRFYLTFQGTIPQQALIEPFDTLELGEPVHALPLGVPLIVAEKGTARALGAKGEIPYKITPGEPYEYADLSGPHGEFATLDYSEQPPLVFIGRELRLAELGFPPDVVPPEREVRRVAAAQLNCPQCAGPLELRAPDKSERVTCPNCSSLLDVSQGKLQFLKALDPRVKPLIPLGSTAEFNGTRFMLIGFMVRSVEFEGVRYYWEEYLLYEPQAGFRWLVRSDDNWNLVETVPPAAVTSSGERAVLYNGKRFKLYQDTAARVEHVYGEFYWKVMTGEVVRAADYIAPPLMLSMEATYTVTPPAGGKGDAKKPKAVQSGEINWSLGAFLKPQEVERAFGITGLPRTSKIAPNQPYPHKKLYKYWALLMLAAMVTAIIVAVASRPQKVFEQTFNLDPIKNLDDSQVKFTDPFELRGRKNVVVTAAASVDNSWVEIDGDLINQATDESEAFSLPVEYYSGVDDGESWSEGNRSPNVYLSAQPAGAYILGFEARWEKFQQPMAVTIRVEQGVFNGGYIVLVLILLSLFPIVMLIYHWRFEVKRWEDSDYSPFQSSS
ncbi:MAG: DUF4178 domain-containing protein [Blastocatellia bacterium]